MSVGKKAKKMKPSPMEMKMAQLARSEWKDYQDIYVPVENALIAEVMRFGSPEAVMDAQGQATGAVHQDLAGASMRGSDTGGRTFGRLRDVAVGTSAGLTFARAGARTEQKDRAARGKLGLVDMGRGIQGLSADALSTAAGHELSTRGAVMQSRQAIRAANMHTIGTLAGAAIGVGFDKWMSKKDAAMPARPYSMGAPTREDYERRAA